MADIDANLSRAAVTPLSNTVRALRIGLGGPMSDRIQNCRHAGLTAEDDELDVPAFDAPQEVDGGHEQIGASMDIVSETVNPSV
jgi:hypothetical protein